jgi:mannose-6-phosphate isomerase-like protein (cupin superfamily)
MVFGAVQCTVPLVGFFNCFHRRRSLSDGVQSVELVRNLDQSIAIIIRSDYRAEGIQFFTSEVFSQQLAYMNRPAGYQIPPHVHNPVQRDVVWTQEVLFIRSGRMRVDFYTDGRHYLESRVVKTGDVVMLVAGGHGFEMLEPTEIIEVKQGPYSGDQDKTRFEPVPHELVKLK